MTTAPTTDTTTGPRPWHELAPVGDNPTDSDWCTHYAAMAWAHYRAWSAAIGTFLAALETYGADAIPADVTATYRATLRAHEEEWPTAWTTAACLSGWTASSALRVAMDDQEVVEEYLTGWLNDAGVDPETIAPAAASEAATRQRKIIETLWRIIDNIDTAADMVKGDDAAFRRIVTRQQARRWETGITTDGFRLTMPWESPNDEAPDAAAGPASPAGGAL